jgi:hypothetical protein
LLSPFASASAGHSERSEEPPHFAFAFAFVFLVVIPEEAAPSNVEEPEPNPEPSRGAKRLNLLPLLLPLFFFPHFQPKNRMSSPKTI